MQRRIRTCGDDVGGHNVGYFAGMGLDVISRERVITGQREQPPRALPLRAGLGPMQQIALAHDTDDFALVVATGTALIRRSGRSWQPPSRTRRA